MTTPGEAFARAVADKDRAALDALLAPDVDFRGMTPRRYWEASDPAGVLDVLFDNWFEPQDMIRSAEISAGDPVEDTESVGYRFHVDTPDGAHTVAQQVYYRVEDGRISYLRVMCSGFRPIGSFRAVLDDAVITQMWREPSGA